MENRFNKIYLNSGRNCLRYIVRAYGIREIQIPYYICPSVRQALFAENVKMKFYHIDKDFMPTDEFSPDEYILYPNYFGICNRQNELLAKKYKNLISDNAHAFFAPITGIAAFNSPRKFFKVNDGGILYSARSLSDNFEQDDNRNTEIRDYETFCKNEISIDNQPIKFMSGKTKNILENTQFGTEITKRTERFNRLHGILCKKNVIKIRLQNDEIPFIYPYMCDNADETVRKLDEHGIYVLRYGSNLPKTYFEYRFFEKLIMLPLKEEVCLFFEKI